MAPVTVADYRPASLSISIVIIIHRQRNRTLEVGVDKSITQRDKYLLHSLVWCYRLEI